MDDALKWLKTEAKHFNIDLQGFFWVCYSIRHGDGNSSSRFCLFQFANSLPASRAKTGQFRFTEKTVARHQ